MVAVWIADLLCTFFGVTVPALRTFKALKRKDMREYQEVIMYWIVYAAFVTITYVTDIFLSWLPFYYELKVAFVLWMTYPSAKGHYYIYKEFIHPRLNEHEPAIDESLNCMNEWVSELSKRAGQSAAAAAVESLSKGQQFLVAQLTKQTSEVTSEVTSDSHFEILDPEEISSASDKEAAATSGKSKAATVRVSRPSSISSKHPRRLSIFDDDDRIKVLTGDKDNISPTTWQRMKEYFGYDDIEPKKED